MQKPLPTFEERIVSRRARHHAALNNLLFLGAKISRDEVFSTIEDISQVHPWIGSIMKGGAVRFDRVAKGVSSRVLRPRIPVVTLFLPGPCPYRCDGCITAASVWESLQEHIAFKDLEKALVALKSFGLRLIRVSGEGEPTQARAFLPLVKWARQNGIDVVSCTNGMRLGSRVLEEFRVNERLYLAVKLLSEDADEQNAIVKPESPKNRVVFEKHPVLGLVPEAFYELDKLAPKRAGFRITVYSSNTPSVKKILRGVKPFLVPTFIGPAEEAGEATGHHELVPGVTDLPYTQFLKAPNWTLWSLAINSVGEVISGMPAEAAMPRGLRFVGTDDPAKTLSGFFAPESDYVGEILGARSVPVMV